jgi:hypothetical protein
MADTEIVITATVAFPTSTVSLPLPAPLHGVAERTAGEA